MWSEILVIVHRDIPTRYIFLWSKRIEKISLCDMINTSLTCLFEKKFLVKFNDL